MYAHQSFIRGKPELLLNLRKCSSASRRKMSTSSHSSESCDSSSSSGSRNQQITYDKKTPQAISPRTILDPFLQSSNVASKLMGYQPNANPTWLTFRHQPLMPKLSKAPHDIRQPNGAGRLDLLALAVEHASF